MNGNANLLPGAHVALSLAARLVHGEPSGDELRAYLSPGFFSESPFGMDDAAVADGLRTLEQWCRHARERLEESSPDNRSALFGETVRELGRDWLQLIAGLGTPKAPSWAGYYLNANSAIMGQSSLDARRLYGRFGFRIERQGREPDDDLGIMLEFLACLVELEDEACVTERASEAEMAESGVLASSEEAREVAKQLLVDLVLPWIAAWRWSMVEYAKTGFYRGVGDLVFGLCRAYARRFGIQYRDDDGVPRFVQA